MPGELQLGQFEMTGRSTTPPPTTRARQRSGGTRLPDWMREPPPARTTIGGRIVNGFARVPGADRIRRRWWSWQERRRLYERYPIGFKIVAFFASWALVTLLVLASYAIFGLA